MKNKYRFELSLSKDVYSKLNKDRKIAALFRSSSVGKCAKIFDDYYKSTKELN